MKSIWLLWIIFDVLSLLSETSKDFKHLCLTESLIWNFLWCCLIFVLIIVALEALFSFVFCGISWKLLMLVLWRQNILLYRIHPEQAVCTLRNILTALFFAYYTLVHTIELIFVNFDWSHTARNSSISSKFFNLIECRY